MIPMKTLYTTQSPLIIHKRKPVENFKYLMEKVRFTILNLGKPLQVCHIIVLMPVFKPNDTKTQSIVDFLSNLDLHTNERPKNEEM